LQKKVPVEFSIDCRLDQVNKFRGDMSLMDYFSAWFGVSLRFYPLIGEDILRQVIKDLRIVINFNFKFRWRYLSSDHSRPTRSHWQIERSCGGILQYHTNNSGDELLLLIKNVFFFIVHTERVLLYTGWCCDEICDKLWPCLVHSHINRSNYQQIWRCHFLTQLFWWTFKEALHLDHWDYGCCLYRKRLAHCIYHLQIEKRQFYCNDPCFKQGLLPLELTFQVESNQMISNLIKVANKEDILFHSETLGPGYVTVRLTSYEKNVGNVVDLVSVKYEWSIINIILI
jgi:hypothetical protein